MLKLFKNLKQEIIPVIIIFGLLILQAMCDLALPQYTSDIVDVGISKYGIENAVPDVISTDTLKAIELFVSEEDKAFIDKYYTATDKYAVSAYNLNTKDNKTVNKLNDIMALPMMAVAMISQSNEYDMQMISMMPYEARTEMIDKITASINEMGDTAIDTATAKVVVAEKEKLEIDVSAQQTYYIFMTGLKMLGVALGGMACAIAVGFLASQVAARIGMKLRLNVFKNVVSFSNAEMDKFSTASLITRSTNDIQQVQMVTVMMLRMVFYAPILGIGGIIKVLNTEADMTWIIAAAVSAILLIVLILLVVAMPKFKAMQNLVDKVNLVAREILTGLPVIRAFSREKHEEKRFDNANIDLTKTQLFTNRVMALMMPTMMFIMNGVTVMIVWFGGKGIDNGSLQVGDMMAFLTYTMQIVMSFLMITMVSIMLPRAGVAAERIDEIVKTKSSIANKANSLKPNGKGVLQFNNVSFSYPNADENVVENIEFTAKPGETTAIIGSTGCGKSTIVNLIPRLYDVTKGSITIDGIDVRDISQKDLRAIIGYVPQKAVLFSGTIESNLKYGGDDITDEQMIKAAQIAQAEEFICAKDEKYDTPIAQGGTNVSGGQKQRLSIARAIAKKPQIYVFDDSFSALDYKTDIVLRKALKEATGNSTVIIVAQRISTILHADQIIVLDDGKISGIGTHKELLKNNEVYKQIAMSQLSSEDIAAIDNESEEV